MDKELKQKETKPRRKVLLRAEKECIDKKTFLGESRVKQLKEAGVDSVKFQYFLNMSKCYDVFIIDKNYNLYFYQTLVTGNKVTNTQKTLEVEGVHIEKTKQYLINKGYTIY